MRFTKLFTLALATAAIAVSGATADPGHGNGGKHDGSGSNCRPKMLVLKGMVTAAPAAGDTSFSLKVEKASRGGRVLGGQTLAINVDSNTRYRKAHQQIQLADLAANDRVLVQAGVCRADLKAAKDAGKLPAMTARRVVVKPLEASKADKSAQ